MHCYQKLMLIKAFRRHMRIYLCVSLRSLVIPFGKTVNGLFKLLDADVGLFTPWRFGSSLGRRMLFNLAQQ
ncbi:hypothetical protein CGI70_23485 [Vibrio parahaemolyticus]|nr:hypothetical protein CGI70_23485 [Vibrio parahaemolyticus]